MNALANLPRILLVDSNVYFAKRVGEALQQLGFEVVPCTQAAYALTMLEWNAPSAILCATNLREMGALEMAPILRADPKTATHRVDCRRWRRQRPSAAGSVSRGLRRFRGSPPHSHRYRRARAQFSGEPPGWFSADADADQRGNGFERKFAASRFAGCDSDARTGATDRRVAHQCQRPGRHHFLRGRTRSFTRSATCSSVTKQ